MIILGTLFICVSVVHLIACFRRMPKIRTATKVLLMPLLCALYCVSAKEVRPLVIVALAFGWLGDVFLLFKGSKLGMLLGIALGLSGLPLPAWFTGAVSAAGGCMSPVAMLLTGITVAAVDFKKLFGNGSVYILSVIRLVAIPLLAIGLFTLLPLTRTEFVCAICSLAMPLGLNTIVVPSAYGNDPSTAAGMAIVSHLLSCGTIPVMFWLMMQVI